MKDEAPSIWSGIFRYSFGMIAAVIAIGFYNNGLNFWASWRLEGVLGSLIFIPLLAAISWMRWDWAPYAAKQRKKG